MLSEQLQYACDLVNRSSRRHDSTAPRCKVGKLCNGRCIPQDHKCGGHTAAILAGGAAVVGAGLLGAGAIALHRQGKQKEQAEGEAFDKQYAKKVEQINKELDERYPERKQAAAERAKLQAEDLGETLQSGLKAKKESIKKEAEAKRQKEQKQEQENRDRRLASLEYVHKGNAMNYRNLTPAQKGVHHEMERVIEQLRKEKESR